MSFCALLALCASLRTALWVAAVLAAHRAFLRLSCTAAAPVLFASAYNRSWEGDHSLYTGAFLKRHSSLWRLTDRGRDQARITGEWLRAHTRSDKDLDPSVAHLQTIYRYYVSEYIRAMETAALMELPESKWFVEVQLRERDWGTFGQRHNTSNMQLPTPLAPCPAVPVVLSPYAPCLAVASCVFSQPFLSFSHAPLLFCFRCRYHVPEGARGSILGGDASARS